MTSQSTTLINLPKLVVGWFKGKKGHSKMNGDLNGLKQSVDVTWTQISPITNSANGVTRRVELKYADHQQEIYSELGLVQKVKKVQRVTLGGVLVTGLAQPIRLPLSNLPQEVREIFGDELIMRDEVTWETESEDEAPELTSESPKQGPARRGSRVAMVTTTESTCQYRFECKVKLKKAVLIQHSQNPADQHYIADIVDTMKSTFPEELEQLQVTGYRTVGAIRRRSRPTAVTWTLTGECEFRWDSQPDIVWT